MTVLCHTSVTNPTDVRGAGIQQGLQLDHKTWLQNYSKVTYCKTLYFSCIL